MEKDANVFGRNDTEIKFETYRYYLECISNYLIQEYNNWQKFGEICIEKTKSIQGFPDFDEKWISRWMKNSWNTEYLLCSDVKDAEFIRISNQWYPIQAYYSIYAASEALSYVIDGNKASGHIKSLRKTTNYFINNNVSPWNFAYSGSIGKTRNNFKPINIPQNVDLPHNLQRRNVTPIEMIAKCLKVEHRHQIEDLFQRKKGQYKYNYDCGAMGILHFLYRLRIKSNYKDMDIFVPESNTEGVINFYNSLKRICFWTLLYIEIILCRKCRKAFIMDLANNYLKLNNKAIQIKERVCYLFKAV